MINGCFTSDGKLTMIKRFAENIMQELSFDAPYHIRSENGKLFVAGSEIGYDHGTCKHLDCTHSLMQCLDVAVYLCYLRVLATVKNMLDIALTEGTLDFLCLDAIEDMQKGRIKVFVLDEEVNAFNKYRDMLRFLCRDSDVVNSDMI